jgi:hypothetical protein
LAPVPKTKSTGGIAPPVLRRHSHPAGPDVPLARSDRFC